MPVAVKAFLFKGVAKTFFMSMLLDNRTINAIDHTASS